MFSMYAQVDRTMSHACFANGTLAVKAVICWSLMERSLELASAWASSAFTMQTDACNRGGRQSGDDNDILQYRTKKHLQTNISTAISYDSEITDEYTNC